MRSPEKSRIPAALGFDRFFERCRFALSSVRCALFPKSGFVHVVARSKSPAFLPLSGSIGNMSTATSAMGTLRPIHDTRLISAAPRVDSLGILRLSGSIGALAQRLGVAARRRAKPDPGSDTNPLNMT
jgi:hypothetical protein